MRIAPRKRKSVTVTVPRREKRSNAKIIKSDSDDDDNNNFLASCDDALQRDPLDI